MKMFLINVSVALGVVNGLVIRETNQAKECSECFTSAEGERDAEAQCQAGYDAARNSGKVGISLCICELGGKVFHMDTFTTNVSF